MLPLIALSALLVVGCGDGLPRDHGRLWECEGFVERNGETVAAFPFDTQIRKCANPTVPVTDVKDECRFNCETAFCTFGLSTEPPFISLCGFRFLGGLTPECKIQDAVFIDLPCDDSQARIAPAADGPARNEISATATARLDVDDHRGSTTAAGPLKYTIFECATDPCTFEIPNFELEVANFSIAGKSVSHASVRNNAPVIGRHFSNGTFEIPPGALAVSVVFEVDGDSGSKTLTNDGPIVGTAIPDTDTFSVSGTFSKDDISVELSLAGTHTNRAPHAVAMPRGQVECNSAGAAKVSLDGRASTDPEGNLQDYVWFMNDEIVETLGVVVPVSLPLGSTTAIKLELTDSHLSIDTDLAQATVVDTTPPELAAVQLDRTCLWPPNGKYVRLDLGDEIRASAVDVCDPTASVRITSVTSNQPDGDSDIIFGSTGVCLRAQRSAPGTRSYTITLTTTDASGNSTSQDVVVQVPASRASGCPATSPHEFIEKADTDRECAFGGGQP